MPTYDYACQACGHNFEEFQSISADPLSKCPECGKRSLKRLIGTGGGVIFKGSGFYQTDYRSDSYKKAAEAEKPKPAGSEGSTDKSTTEKKSGAAGASSSASTSSPGDSKTPNSEAGASRTKKRKST